MTLPGVSGFDAPYPYFPWSAASLSGCVCVDGGYPVE
jgi:hypothetical protein